MSAPVPGEPSEQRWYGCDAEAASLAWEAAHGYDSIPTIERVYEQTLGGAYVCCYPECAFRRRDAEALWRHVHTAHAPDSCLPPDDFDPGPWL